MSLFAKPEVKILKESSNAKEYLAKLEELQKTVSKDSPLHKKIDNEISIVKAGIIGEENILFELKNSGMDLVVLHDICLVDADGNSAQIDFIVLTPYVRVFIECKNLFGDIEITNNGEFIRTIAYGGKKYQEGLYSPITQNERHMLVFKNCLTEDKTLIMRLGIEKCFNHWNRSLVVLANPKTILNDQHAPKDIKSKVIRADQLIKTLKAYKASSKFNQKELLEDGEHILAMNHKDRKDYLERFIALKESLDEEAILTAPSETTTEPQQGPEPKHETEPSSKLESTPAPTAASAPAPEDPTIQDFPEERLCPRCGSKLILRTAKRGNYVGNQFWGCSQYPKCKYMENLIPDHD